MSQNNPTENVWKSLWFSDMFQIVRGNVPVFGDLVEDEEGGRGWGGGGLTQTEIDELKFEWISISGGVFRWFHVSCFGTDGSGGGRGAFMFIKRV